MKANSTCYCPVITTLAKVTYTRLIFRILLLFVFPDRHDLPVLEAL